MERYITDERTGLKYELVGRPLPDRRGERAGGKIHWRVGSAASPVSQGTPGGLLYDCPQVWTLRRYRDYTLAETWVWPCVYSHILRHQPHPG